MSVLSILHIICIILLAISLICFSIYSNRLLNNSKRQNSTTRDIIRDTKQVLLEMNEDRTALIRDSNEVNSRSEQLQAINDDIRELVKTGFLDEIQLLHRKLDALGARWGHQSENAFRTGMEEILTKLGFRVEKYRKKDEKGDVFGHPGVEVEIDVVTINGETFLVEIKSGVNRHDVFTFNKIVKFYERKENRTADLKILISPFADKQARDFAKQLGIKVCTDPTNLDQ